ncbi:MAG: hypothetical protein QY306_06490 [Anaerolineales bacterium]|nr:MAG: hypothetical protein QY306_06490 [Anaerolineales bacterium]
MNGKPRSPFTQRAFSLFILIAFLLACGLPKGTPSPASSVETAQNILVSLTDPLDGEAYPISAELSVRGEAISDHAIARMELWADGELYETYAAPEDGLGLLVHYWDWSPTTLGSHTLMVRAYNAQGQSAISNVTRIKGIEDPGYVVITQAEKGDTVANIAERYGAIVEEVARHNPDLQETASLSAGTEVIVPIGAPAIVMESSAGAKALMKLHQWSGGIMSGDASVAPPTLTVTGQGCAAALSIGDASDNERGFNIYRLDPDTMSFSQLTSLPVHEGTGSLSHQDANLYGLYHYYVTAYDGDGESASNLVSVKIADANCAGEPTPIESFALVPMSVDQYYLYLSINGGEWRRFPADDFTYLKRADDIDFGRVANALLPNFDGDISIKGETWGMVNGTATRLGTFEKSFKANQPPASSEPPLLSFYLKTKLEVRGGAILDTNEYDWLTEKGFNYGTETFRFGTDTGAADGIWQVASAPFSGDASLNPACLLLTDKTNGSGAIDTPFKFVIDFSKLLPKIENITLSPFENMLDQTLVFASPYSPEKMNAAGGQAVTMPVWNDAMVDVGGVSLANFDPCAQNVSAEGVTTYFVRVLPVKNGQPVGASNTVKVMYDPNSGIKITIPVAPIPQATYYDVKILNFTGVHVPQQEYAYCVVVVENPNTLYPYKPGDVVCPKNFTGGSKNDLLDTIEDAFNFISGLYNKLSDWVTELVDKLNPLCIQAKLASEAIGEGQKQVKDACHFIAAAVVTAAKTYVGLPPSLPNFDQLTELGKENLVELAAQQLEDNGVPCPEDCKDVIRKGIDYATEQVKQSMSNSSCLSEAEAHANGKEPLCLKGVTTKPDPRGQPAPAVLEVQVTRRPNTTGANFPEPQSCNVNISASASNTSHVGLSYGSEAGFQWNGAPIEGKLFTGEGAFPNLQPGESTVIPIILDPFPFWLTGHKEFVNKGWQPEHYDDWGILYQGAQATINAGGACKFVFPEGTGFSATAVSGDVLQVGPLGEAWNQPCYPYDCP